MTRRGTGAAGPGEPQQTPVVITPGTPPAVLAAVVTSDADDATVAAAAAHPDVPLGVVALFAADVRGGPRGVHAVRVGLARNPAAKPAWLTAFAGDDASPVRFGVAANPATPPDVLRRLALDPVPEVRRAARHNPASPPDARAASGLLED